MDCQTAHSPTGRDGYWPDRPGMFSYVLLLLIGVLWLTTRQYHGIIHDSRLYAAQALNLLYAGQFSNDLYFHFGSQDRFTVFSYLYAPLIRWLGVSHAAMVTTVVGQTIWLCGLAYLSLMLFRDRLDGLLAIAAVIALSGFYGMPFEYGEPFATPRLFAEGIDLFALGFLLRARHGWAFFMLALAVPLHPIMALVGVVFALVYLASQRPMWWLVLIGASIATVGIAMAGIPPFANLGIKVDKAWFRIIEARSPLCLITQWSVDAYCRTLAAIAMAVLALFVTEKPGRNVLVSALLVGVGGLVCTLLGGDLAHDALIIQIQPWRSMWLLTLIAHLYVISVLRRLYEEPTRLDVVRLGFTGALIPGVLSQFIPQFIEITAALMAIITVVGAWQLRTGRRLSIAVRHLALFATALGGAATIVFCYGFKVLLDTWPYQFQIRATSCLLLFAALASMIWLLCRGYNGQWKRRLAPPIGIALLLLSLYGWDARDPWARFVESDGPLPTLAALLPAGGTVYWEGGLRLLWLRLQRPSYFSCAQGAGIAFFRGTAIEFERRATSFWTLKTLDFLPGSFCPPFDNTAVHERTRYDLRRVCQREPALDYLALAWPVKNVETKTWFAQASLRELRLTDKGYVPFTTDRFYIYACADLR